MSPEAMSRCAVRWRNYQGSRVPWQRIILKRDDFTCQRCGYRETFTNEHGIELPLLTNLHLDHVEAYSRGGETVPENLQVLCRRCNLSKGAKVVDPNVRQPALFDNG